MAVRAAIATGNWTDAATWGLVDSTSYLNSEASSGQTSAVYTFSSTFTPGAIVVSHICVKLSVRGSTVGTVTACIGQGGVAVAGTEVVMNAADVQVAASADLNGGWLIFKLATPVTLLAATAYTVGVKSSTSNALTLFGSSTSNWSRAIATTTTGAPAAGDDVIIGKEHTGQGTSNSIAVTMDNTNSATDYGAASTSLVTPAIAICNGGSLLFGTTAATNYYLKVSGNLIVYSGGTFGMGTTGTKCPRDSSMTLHFDCVANVDFGYVFRNLCTVTGQGLSRTSSKDVFYCKLNTDEAIASTSLGVDTDTGWLDNDEIAIASTTRTIADCESGALNGNAGASSLTVDGFAGAGGGLAVAHSGTSPTQAEVILLTRNVRIIGTSVTVQTFGVIEATATVDFDWVEFKWHGSGTTNKRGLNINTLSTTTCTFNFCSFRNWEVSSSIILIGSTAATIVNFTDCVFYRMQMCFTFSSGSATGWTIFGCIFINILTSPVVNFFTFTATFSNNTIVGANGTVLTTGTTGTTGTPTLSNNTFHSNNGAVFSGTNMVRVTWSNTTIWRHNTSAIVLNGMSDIIFDTMTIFGCSGTGQISYGGGITGMVTFINLTMNGDTTFSSATGFDSNNNSMGFIKVINGDFSTVSGIKTAHTTSDIRCGNTNCVVQITLINTKLGAASEVSSQTNLPDFGFVTSEKHDQTAGQHKTWKRLGTIESSTTQAQSDTMSMRMIPNNSTSRLESCGKNGGFKVIVASGQACTPSVYVFEDATYNGARARLVLKRNDAMGITSDTIIDTATAASDLAWEQLTGTTIAATMDGVMEFVVDCNGTAGSIYIDTFTATVA